MLSPNLKKELRVLVLDPLPKSALKVFADANYKIDENFETLSESELVKTIGDYNIVCLRNERDYIYLTDEVLRSGHRLLAVGVFSRFVSQVDLQTAQVMGIPVFNSPYQHQLAVAELIVSSTVLLARQIGDRSREIHEKEWNKVSANCYEVRGKTMGIVGYGHIGSQLGILAEAMGMKVIFYDDVAVMPIGNAEPRESLNDLLSQSDFVSINVSLTPENSKMIGKEQIAKMKKGSYLINAAYGEAIDLDALSEALKSGHLRGAALDAFPQSLTDVKAETFSNPFEGCKNVILTPQIGDKTIESFERMGSEVATALVRYVTDGTTVGAINFPSIAAWPLRPNTRRIVNMHRNVRGVLKEIDNILAAYNVGKQVLDTKDGLGYLIADIGTDSVTAEIVSQLALLANTIRTRIL
ncbi:phosphoglycerate dehydrogenase [Cladochytrium replicatum]|nr:phosphoglycerate dehydrogenase [Cladochytrium replicatum]